MTDNDRNIALPERVIQALNAGGSPVAVPALCLAGLFGVLAALLFGPLLGPHLTAVAAAGSIASIAAASLFYLFYRQQIRELAIAAEGLRRAAAIPGAAHVITDRLGHLLWADDEYLKMCGRRAPAPAALFSANSESRRAFDRFFARARAASGVEREVFPFPDSGWVRVAVSALGNSLFWRFESIAAKAVIDAAIKPIERLFPEFDALGIAVAAVDEAGAIVSASPMMRALAGRSAAELPGMPLSLLLGKEKRDGECLIESVGGCDIPGPMPESLAGRILLFRDAGSTRKLNADSGNMPGNLMEDAPLGVALLKADGTIAALNRACERLLPAGTGVGDSLLSVIQEEEREELSAHLKAVMEPGSRSGAPIELHLGVAGESSTSAYFSRNRSGGDAGIIAYLVNTTEQKRLELQFVQAQKMQAVGQLAGGVAHDFNNLLTAIIGFCDLLLVRHGPGDQSFSDIMQVKQNANRAANLVRQLLAFSRQQTLRPRVLLLTDVLSEISDLVRRLIGENIELAIKHGRDLGPIRVDQGQLEQVIINLSVNARDAMPHGGRLSIRTRHIRAASTPKEGHDLLPMQDWACIEISDSGTGIAPENLEKIFDPFFTTKEVGKGTGLGLSTVYGIVKQTGGFIFCRSAVGEGTTFQVYFPEYHAEVIEAPAEKREMPVRDLTGKGTILLVEDEDPVRMFASRALANKGYEVLEASSGEGGLHIVENHKGPIDLLISDIVMPNMDGPALVRLARAKRPEMRIIFISGYAEDALRQNLLEFNYTLLPKPFTLKQLAEQVKETLSSGN